MTLGKINAYKTLFDNLLFLFAAAVFDRMETIPETSIVHRLRALFEKAVKLRANSNCVMLWRCYMRFEVSTLYT